MHTIQVRYKINDVPVEYITNDRDALFSLAYLLSISSSVIEFKVFYKCSPSRETDYGFAKMEKWVTAWNW